MNAKKGRLSRRRFLHRAGFALAAPSFIVSRAVGGAADLPASERVVAALIGCGGRGLGLLGIHDDPRSTLAAVCDVDQKRLAATKKRIGKCDAYSDFRRILDRQDIDAVLIATPDHWHAALTVMACQAGKDVYCEKPLCRTITEGRKMVEVARRYGRIVQMGTQYRSIARSRQACEWVRNGRLGKVLTVRLSLPPNRTHPREPPQPVP
ncbi:MAG: Gfo/Idh/MocA family oxidoreductase, partial [Planctomycetota bacterium]